jgi:hypothetical protein
MINSCSGFKSANLIGTKSNDGTPNVAVFSSVTHLGSNPPLLGIVFRPVSDVPRNTYENIKETGQFTINHIHLDIIEQAHHTSAKYDKGISEFDITNLEEEYKNDWHAPFVKGCPVQMALTYCEEYIIKANNTIQLIDGSTYATFKHCGWNMGSCSHNTGTHSMSPKSGYSTSFTLQTKLNKLVAIKREEDVPPSKKKKNTNTAMHILKME